MKNELDELIKSEKQQKEKKRMHTIIGAVLVAALTVCVIVYLNNDNKEGMAHSVGEVVTDTMPPISDSTETRTGETDNEPKESAQKTENEAEASEAPESEERGKLAASKEPKASKKAAVRKKEAALKKEAARKKASVTKEPVASRKPARKRNPKPTKQPSKGSIGDDSVGTLDGL